MELIINQQVKAKRKTNQLIRDSINITELEKIIKDPTIYDEEILIDKWRKYIYQ